MAEARWDQRFFATTRGRIVQMLRRAARTVDEMAHSLDLTDNAVRSHLATLERDGLVEQSGLRRGERRPAYVYSLTPGAENLFPRAYEPVLHRLLDALGERLPPDVLDATLRDVGRRLAADKASKPPRDPRARVHAAAAVLEGLGGLVEVEESEGLVRLRGFSCPLAGVVPGHPGVCSVAETLLAELVGAPVRECCDRQGDRPHCRFEVDVPGRPAE